MPKTLRALLVLICLSFMPACGAVLGALPQVISAVTDAAQIVDSIKDFTDAYFVAHPAPDKKAVVDTAIGRAKQALNLALRTANGAQELDQKQVDAAFTDFKQAYEALLVLVSPLGVRQEGAEAPLRASPDGQALIVPEPAALSLKLRPQS